MQLVIGFIALLSRTTAWNEEASGVLGELRGIGATASKETDVQRLNAEDDFDIRRQAAEDLDVRRRPPSSGKSKKAYSGKGKSKPPTAASAMGKSKGKGKHKPPTPHPTHPTPHPTHPTPHPSPPPSTPAPVGREAGYTYSYVGCFFDDRERDFDFGPRQFHYTLRTCLQACGGDGFSFLALQQGSYCSCDNSYSTPMQQYPRLDDSRCGGVAGTGGGWANAVYYIYPGGGTDEPTEAPTEKPTEAPTEEPSPLPTANPSPPPTGDHSPPPTPTKNAWRVDFGIEIQYEASPGINPLAPSSGDSLRESILATTMAVKAAINNPSAVVNVACARQLIDGVEYCLIAKYDPECECTAADRRRDVASGSAINICWEIEAATEQRAVTYLDFFGFNSDGTRGPDITDAIDNLQSFFDNLPAFAARQYATFGGGVAPCDNGVVNEGTSVPGGTQGTLAECSAICDAKQDCTGFAFQEVYTPKPDCYFKTATCSLQSCEWKGGNPIWKYYFKCPGVQEIDDMYTIDGGIRNVLSPGHP